MTKTTKPNTIVVDKLTEKINRDKSEDFNKSTVFLLPMIKADRDFLNKNFHSIVNLYYYCEEDLDYNNAYKNRIYCVFKQETFDLSKAEGLFNCPEYLGKLERGDYLIFVFRVPDIYLHDFLMFKKGLYSRMSPEYKELLIKSYPGTIKNVEYIRRILNPTDEDRNQLSIFLETKGDMKEVYSAPEDSEETFKQSNFWKIIRYKK